VFSPSDLGQWLKPFVFLDHFDVPPTRQTSFAMHPHSGISTLTILLSGTVSYEDTTGAHGHLGAGGVEWFQAGAGAWHEGRPVDQSRIHGYQLWLALPPALELSPPRGQYLSADVIPEAGPARVVLGQYDGQRSPVAALPGQTCLHVRLEDGACWTYRPGAGQTVAWTHVNQGTLLVSGQHLHGELAVFEPSEQSIEFRAQGAVDLIVASAIAHPHELVLGDYSVHTSLEALRAGEREITRVGSSLHPHGRTA
jgi:redox-sensitive bicupin YhaK (pirin superfamily)